MINKDKVFSILFSVFCGALGFFTTYAALTVIIDFIEEFILDHFLKEE